MSYVWSDEAWQDYVEWQQQDAKIRIRMNPSFRCARDDAVRIFNTDVYSTTARKKG